jgi:hypothetical protein
MGGEARKTHDRRRLAAVAARASSPLPCHRLSKLRPHPSVGAVPVRGTAANLGDQAEFYQTFKVALHGAAGRGWPGVRTHATARGFELGSAEVRW